jgi:ankyrin repeat protein
VDPSVNDNQLIELAAEKGYSDIVELLIKHPKVKADIRDYVPLRKASLQGHTNVIKILCEQSLAELPLSFDNHFLLKTACENGHENLVSYLLNHNRWEAQEIDFLSISKVVKVHSILEMLFNSPKIKKLPSQQLLPQEYFFICCKNGTIDLLKWWHKKHADQINPAAEGNYALHLAISHGHFLISKYLLQWEDVEIHSRMISRAISKNQFVILHQLAFDSDLQIFDWIRQQLISLHSKQKRQILAAFTCNKLRAYNPSTKQWLISY